MADYALCCCSTADISEELLQSRDIKYVYFNYELNGVQCRDDFGRTNTPSELYRKMLEGQPCRTSQVSVGQYMTFWKPFLEAGQDVFHLTLSSGISGSYESAVAAREELKGEFPNRKVVVVDSLQASAGYGLLVDKAADKRDEGLTIDELEAWALENRDRVYAWFFSTDLTFFIRGGRISKAAGLLGGMLNICPVMDVEPDGSLAVKEKARGRKKAERRIIDIMRNSCEGGSDYADKVFISNSECLKDAESVADKVRTNFPQVKTVDIFDIGATIGVHTGPGTVATFWWGAKGRA